MIVDARKAAYTDNHVLPKVAERLRAEIESGAKQLDIVTGYIAPSAWGVLGNALESLEQCRILLGKDFQLAGQGADDQSKDIRALVAAAIDREGQPPSLPSREDAAAVAAALKFLRRANVDVKVWTDGFLHAKAYILPATAGVGSANFTAGGLIHNRELVTWREDRGIVEELAAWFQGYWSAEPAVDYKEELIAALDATTFGDHRYTPYELLIRVLAERYGIDRPPSLELATFSLKWFQEDAVYRLIQMINGPARGALLADAVGLGKTYMALGVMHHLLYNATRGRGKGRPVLVLAPASVLPIWKLVLERYGMDWACRLETLQSLDANRDVTDLQGAGLVVVDEAHRLRRKGVWYRKVLEVLRGGSDDKRVLLLTATPVNTGIDDLTALLQVVTKNRRNIFAPAIADFEAYLKRVEKRETDAFPLLDRTVVRRSRSDIMRDYDQRIAAGIQGLEKPTLPERELHHAGYKYVGKGGVELFSDFASTLRSLSLAPYDLAPFQSPIQLDLAGMPVRAPNSLAALVAAGLLKRFESSLRAVALSLKRLDVLLKRFGEAVEAWPPKLLDLAASPGARALLDEERATDEEGVDEFDKRWHNMVESLPELPDASVYDIAAIRSAIAADRTAVGRLIGLLPDEDTDPKIEAIRMLFGSRGRLHQKRVVLFSQFRDTARYVHERLSEEAWTREAAVGRVALIHGGTDTKTRQVLVSSFDPDADEARLLRAARAEEEVSLMVSTDVLAEGHNLQLAEAVVNLDLHWNPQVAVQRAGRIDRLNSPHKKVTLVSFLPDEGLDAHLGLIRALDRRFGVIHEMGMGDEPVTKLVGDKQSLTLEQMRRLYADDVNVLDEIERTWTLGSTDFMRAPLEAFMARHGAEMVKKIPVGVQSVKRLPRDWKHGPGVFVAFKFGEETIWRLYPRDGETWASALADESEMFRAIVCPEREPRREWEPDFPGPGGVIDWKLLYRAAIEVANELTRRRATAALQRGASERSRTLRLQIRDLTETVGEVDGADALLDRLDEVRVEDYDHASGWRPFVDRLRESKRAQTAGERHDLFVEAVKRGLAVLGSPTQDQANEVEAVKPEDLRLIAWELLVAASGVPALPQQTRARI